MTGYKPDDRPLDLLSVIPEPAPRTHWLPIALLGAALMWFAGFGLGLLAGLLG